MPLMKSEPYWGVYSATTALDAVAQWASQSYLLRETGSLRCGRIDGILVPVRWDANPKVLSGVEVKVSRNDFLRGLNGGQFERYAEKLPGFYIATPAGVCKTAEVPSRIGHLVVATRPGHGLVCVCRRKPCWRTVSMAPDEIWRIVWDLFDQFEKERRKEADAAVHLRERICERAANAMRRLVTEDRTCH